MHTYKYIYCHISLLLYIICLLISIGLEYVIVGLLAFGTKANNHQISVSYSNKILFLTHFIWKLQSTEILLQAVGHLAFSVHVFLFCDLGWMLSPCATLSSYMSKGHIVRHWAISQVVKSNNGAHVNTAWLL